MSLQRGSVGWVHVLPHTPSSSSSYLCPLDQTDWPPSTSLSCTSLAGLNFQVSTVELRKLRKFKLVPSHELIGDKVGYETKWDTAAPANLSRHRPSDFAKSTQHSASAGYCRMVCSPAYSELQKPVELTQNIVTPELFDASYSGLMKLTLLDRTCGRSHHW